MNKFKQIIGIDISKHTFDATFLQVSNSETRHEVFAQNEKGFTAFLKEVQHAGVATEETLICLEHTGMYIHPLMDALKICKCFVWVEMPLRIKRSIGLHRGGDDKLSSLLIAQYALRYQDQAIAWVVEDSFLQKLRYFTAQRERLLTSIKQLQVPLKELQEIGMKDLSVLLTKTQKKVIKELEIAVKNIEQQIQGMLKDNEEAQKVIQRVCSLKGVSTQTAINLYVYTKGFKTFSNAKQLACYCGVVPFEKRSGISIRYKPKVSPYANKNLKRLLHLCAMSAIQCDAELKTYYQRKVAEGKNKMSALNAVRNKLVLRIFAVVRDGRNYEVNRPYKCA